MELRKRIPFGYRVAVGVGFFAIGLAGLIGAGKEAGAAAVASFRSTGAEWDENMAGANAFASERTHHQVGALVDLGTGSLSIAASAVLMQGAWRRIMRTDGRWAYEDMATAEPLPELLPAAEVAAAYGEVAMGDAVAQADTEVPGTGPIVVGNVYYPDFGEKREAS